MASERAHSSGAVCVSGFREEDRFYVEIAWENSHTDACTDDSCGKRDASHQCTRQKWQPVFQKKKLVAHREGRTRSLQIIHPLKSLTLYPIELGGR